MWQHRNAKEHKDDIEKQTQALRDEVQREIEKGTEGIQELHKLFTKDELEKVKGNNLAYARAWIRNVAARRRWVERQKSSSAMQGMRRIMQQFLGRDNQGQ
jgi:hypothetical protein